MHCACDISRGYTRQLYLLVGKNEVPGESYIFLFYSLCTAARCPQEKIGEGRHNNVLFSKGGHLGPPKLIKK